MNHFDDSRPITLSWLPDETLFSLCSRYHHLSQNYKSSTTCQQLFGHQTQGLAHDFPSRIDFLVSATEGLLGTSDEIIYRRSILFFYLPLAREHTKRSAIAAMKGNGIGHLKLNLGILTSRFRANHPLKACPKCLLEDRENHQVAYWHRAHQLPGVWICALHGEHLLTCITKANGVQRFFWCLPDINQLEFSLDPSRVNSHLINSSLMKLTHSSIALANLPESFSFSQTQLQQCYLTQLCDRGFLKKSGLQIKLRELGALFSEYSQTLRTVPELMALPNNPDEAIALSRKMITPRAGTHPLRHLIWINWLFENWDDFLQKYGDTSKTSFNATSFTQPKVTSQNPKKAELIRLLQIEGWAVTRAAKHLNIDFGTAAAWATKVKIKVPTRPSKMTTEIRKEMIGALIQGKEKQVIAKKHGLSVTTVTKLLSTEIGLSEAWHEARFIKTQASHRKTWQTVVKNNPNIGMKAARILESTAFAWLYRNDREWLAEHSAQLSRVQHQNHSKTDWDSRDRDLAQQVREVALELYKENPNRKLLLWMIYQKLPDLKAKLAKLDRLPLTKSAILMALKSLKELS